MVMKLIFKDNSPLDTTLVDEASGAVMYEIDTDGGLFSKTTTIRKPLTDQRTPHTFTEVAKIKWKTWSPDRIIYGGRDMEREEFIPKAGLFGSAFLITADGATYRWSTSFSGGGLPRLVTNDHEKNLIAKLHKANYIFNKRDAFLEVTPAGVAMLDLIVVSLVYVEVKRRARQRQNSASMSSGGASGVAISAGGGSGGGGGC